MNKRKIIAIASFFMVILLVILFSNNKHNLILGDFILTKMGISVWSDGNSGLHYTGVITLTLILLGVAGIICFNEDVHRNFGKFVVLFFIVGSIIYQPTYDIAYGFVKSKLSGLQTIEYIRDGSQINYTNNGGIISLNGKIKLKNYSNDKKEFYIKIPILEDYLSKNAKIITVSNTLKEPVKFVVFPNRQVNLDINFSILDRESEWQSGNLNPPSIIIYNDTEEIYEGK
ncbi:hypothetical protein Cpap_3755 [Ruminiclostridium papyrosolvens DSM 2782]|uniref:Uncharacterized protein n=1 Tax=Ruminiclostridium papyrosolvens DSM 2782 TaxID=588581 RepID=F1T775_9FIRM|nr:hypothetical protein [Ruminiclostridium papyrosolvens]EGD49323.1 hypothetical protein Cpap_3755 [Ruminiclostridium papyrosolvens DSM 2782]WES33548.1 hypothetical protein P0092_17530 [Ruminiclostridium papyrosolvens DSM 2782]